MKPTLVVIDDDEMFLRDLEKRIGEERRIRTFTSVDEAMNYLSGASDVGTVYVDLSMEDCVGVHWQLGGLDVLNQIRRQLGEKTPKLCVLSGMEQAVHIYTCLKNGADAFIQKSHDTAETAQKIMQAS